MLLFLALGARESINFRIESSIAEVLVDGCLLQGCSCRSMFFNFQRCLGWLICVGLYFIMPTS
jgi:hypothetical protein